MPEGRRAETPDVKSLIWSTSRKFVGGLIIGVVSVIALSTWIAWRDTWKSSALLQATANAYECGTEFQDFACEVQAFQSLTEQALVWRGEAQTYLRHVSEARRAKGLPLTSEDLSLLHDGVVRYLSLREQIMTFAHKYRDAGERELKPNATTEAGRLFAWRSTLALAAALVLYDNYLIGIQPFQDDGSLRRLINNDNVKARLAIDQVTLSYRSRANLVRVARGLRFFEAYRKEQTKLGIQVPEQVAYLDALVLGSPTFQSLQRKIPSQLSFIAQSLDWLVTALTDRLTDYRTELMGQLSGSFGNAVGLIELRKGLLYGQPALAAKIEGGLKPLDILLEKTPFRLTDALIPGHWGHVAIWVGSPEELMAAGVWDHPAVQKHHLAIRQGRRVIEALREGVVASSLEHFLNIDDLAVLRPRELSAETRRHFLIKAFEQIGKEYDFNFDVETDKRIVCSELVYVVFDQGYDWPTERMLGRATISPDNVARAVMESKNIDVEILYHQGREVAKDQRALMAALLEASGTALKDVAELRDGGHPRGGLPTEAAREF